MSKNRSLEHEGYPSEIKAKWGQAIPLGMHVIEFSGDGDPMFGGAADDRVLGANGSILPRSHNGVEAATFNTVEEAHEAAKLIPNRRPGSILGVAPWWR